MLISSIRSLIRHVYRGAVLKARAARTRRHIPETSPCPALREQWEAAYQLRYRAEHW